MPMALVCLNCTLPLMMPSAIALSVCSGVGGCMCLSSSRMILMQAALHAIMYRPVSSASVAEDITFLMMCAMFRIAPLFGGKFVLLERKKCAPTWLRAFGYRSNSLRCCVLLAPYCWHGRRVRRLLARPGNWRAVVFVALCLQLVWMTAMLWCWLGKEWCYQLLYQGIRTCCIPIG